MRRKNLGRYLLVVVTVALRGARRWQRRSAPKLRIVVRAIVKVAGGNGEHAEVLAVHVVVAAAAGAAFAVAAAFSGGPASELLQLARIAAIGVVAVSAAVVLVRRARSAAQLAQLPSMRPLMLAAAQRVDTSLLPAAQALQLACAPNLLWEGPNALRVALTYAARQAAQHVALHPLRSASRALAPALELMGAYQNTVDDVRFVRRFALTAVEISRAELRGGNAELITPRVLALH